MNPRSLAVVLVPLLLLSGLPAQEGPSPETLRGRVLDVRTEEPVVGAEVALAVMRRRGRGETLETVRSGPGGGFTLELPEEPRRGFVVRVRAPGYVTGIARIRRDAGEELVVRLERARTLRGRVLDRESGDPVGGLTVTLARESVETDARGRFTLRSVPPELSSDQALLVSGEGYALQQVRGPFEAGLTIPVDAAVALEVQVVDDAGEPVEGATVQARYPFATAYSPLQRRGFEGTTDAQGEVLLEGLSPRRGVVVQARGEGRIRAQSPVMQVSGGRDAPARCRLILSRGRHAGIRVLNGHGRPVAGAEVRVLPPVEPLQAFQGHVDRDTSQGPIRFGETDEVGVFALDGLPAHPVTFEVRAEGLQTVMAVVHPEEEPGSPRDLHLRRDPDPPGHQIPWRPGIGAAFKEAERRNLPVMVQMTMDGERANDYMATHHFRDPEVVRVAREMPILLASAYGPGGLSASGVAHEEKDGISVRYGAVPASVYQDVEAWARETFIGSSSFSVPKEILVTPGGREILHRTYYLSERELVRVMLRGARFMQPELPLRLARARLAPLCRRLAGTDPEERARAVDDLVLLVNSGDEHARALLGDLPDLGVTAAFRVSVVSRLVMPGIHFPASALRSLVRDLDPDVRRAACRRLEEVVADPDVVDLLASRLDEPDPKTAEVLHTVLGLRSGEDGWVVDAPTEGKRWRLVEELLARVPPDRIAGLSGLLDVLPAKARHRLLRAAAGGSPGSRGENLVLRELRSGDQDAIGAIRAVELMLERRDDPDREACWRALAAASQSGRPLMRETALEAVTRHFPFRSPLLLEQALKDLVFTVRFRAARLMAAEGDAAGARVLLEGFRWPGTSRQAQESLQSLYVGEAPEGAAGWRRWLQTDGSSGE